MKQPPPAPVNQTGGYARSRNSGQRRERIQERGQVMNQGEDKIVDQLEVVDQYEQEVEVLEVEDNQEDELEEEEEEDKDEEEVCQDQEVIHHKVKYQVIMIIIWDLVIYKEEMVLIMLIMVQVVVVEEYVDVDVFVEEVVVNQDQEIQIIQLEIEDLVHHLIIEAVTVLMIMHLIHQILYNQEDLVQLEVDQLVRDVLVLKEVDQWVEVHHHLMKVLQVIHHQINQQE
eukprot:CAMPEP_0114658472 /NCGR_PEP_ID=MMETSP0191-20121206/15833_1 /TAXON_ID=126664 /ORGANISM="Sorites sp." /LENGTH=227 /DNA_ID=CAMNT_0001880631 /DNA_START=1436 /DNA_END=2120 /DNA_ORIENTATION=-